MPAITNGSRLCVARFVYESLMKINQQYLKYSMQFAWKIGCDLLTAQHQLVTIVKNAEMTSQN